MTLRVGQFARIVKTNEITLITEDNIRSSTQDYKCFVLSTGRYVTLCYEQLKEL